MSEQEQANNPYNICTWQDVSECKDCSIAGLLICRHDPGYILYFRALFLSFLLPALIGMILGGYGQYILGWIVFGIIFFGFWEPGIICSHCPYYAEERRALRCILKYGFTPKFRKYRPEPISKSEKVQIGIGFTILAGYPFLFLILGGQYILAALAIWGMVISCWTLQKYLCPKCINFSCTMNQVPKEVVDEYLKRNPVMRKAWEEHGWQIGEKMS